MRAILQGWFDFKLKSFSCNYDKCDAIKCSVKMRSPDLHSLKCINEGIFVLSIIYSYITHFHHSQQQVCDEYQLLLIVGSSLDNFTTNIQKKGWEGGGKCPFSHDHFHACMAVMVTKPWLLYHNIWKITKKISFYKFTVISARTTVKM